MKDELEALRRLRLVTEPHKVRLPDHLRPRHALPSEVNVIVGISVRPDNSGGGHKHDQDGLAGCKQLFARRQRVRLGLGEVDVKVSVVALPRSQARDHEWTREALQAKATTDLREERNKPVKTDVKESITFGSFEPALLYADVEGVDLVYIPGAPVAPPTQRTNQHGMKADRGFKHDEALSRNAYERKLIEAAMHRGIPILAVCAGSWRLLEAYGGQVRELDSREIHTHHHGGWNASHGLQVDMTASHTLRDAASRASSKDAKAKVPGDGRFQGANTTHWAVADAGATGTLVTNPSQAIPSDPHGRLNRAKLQREPDKLLRVTVREPTTGTVEGFETAHGAPNIGVQWHPESFLPGMKGNKEKYANDNTISFSQEIFRVMVLAAATSKLRRLYVVPELRDALSRRG